MKKEILFYGLIFVIIVAAIVILNFDFDKKIYDKYFKGEDSESEGSGTGGLDGSGEGSISEGSSLGSGSGGGGGGGGGGRGGGSSGGESGEENKTKELPSDAETRECGFYTEEYEICTGVCPSGECVSEGRSCYCK